MIQGDFTNVPWQPRARMSLYRSDVKERCSAVFMPTLLAHGSATQIAEVVRKQLSIYTYMFPLGPGVSQRISIIHDCDLTSSQSLGARGIVRRSRPYRNDRIITVLHDLYFTGGSRSFASQYEHLFPTHKGDDGKECREVPIAMVSLVATAVSDVILSRLFCYRANLIYQLYATLYEWRTGELHTQEFSANTYLDVYLAHVGTIKHILESRPPAFHTMMSDIYTQAR